MHSVEETLWAMETLVFRDDWARLGRHMSKGRAMIECPECRVQFVEPRKWVAHAAEHAEHEIEYVARPGTGGLAGGRRGEVDPEGQSAQGGEAKALPGDEGGKAGDS